LLGIFHINILPIGNIIPHTAKEYKYKKKMAV